MCGTELLSTVLIGLLCAAAMIAHLVALCARPAVQSKTHVTLDSLSGCGVSYACRAALAIKRQAQLQADTNDCIACAVSSMKHSPE